MTDTIVETLWDRDGKAYQTRVKCGHFRIHIFWREDRDPDMHDHPADFWTFPLVSYVEERTRPNTPGHIDIILVRAFRPHYRKAEYQHRVLGAWDGTWVDTHTRCPGRCSRPIVTIGWWMRKRRHWGFWTIKGFVPWEKYIVNHTGWKEQSDG